MTCIRLISVLLCTLMISSCSQMPQAIPLAHGGGNTGIPEGFVYVQDCIPHLDIQLAYAKDSNIIGKKLPGYDQDSAVLTIEAVQALQAAEKAFRAQGYALVLYDAYRPNSAHKVFYAWAQDLQDEATKAKFYPDLDKKRILEESFLSNLTEHSRGSTVDVSLKNLKTGKLLNMGGFHDLIADKARTASPLITKEQARNRAILVDGLAKVGFKNYPTEWWHFTLINERYPISYWDFDMRRPSKP